MKLHAIVFSNTHADNYRGAYGRKLAILVLTSCINSLAFFFRNSESSSYKSDTGTSFSSEVSSYNR